MSKKRSGFEAIKGQQLLETVYDNSDQVVLEEGIIIGSTELVILRNRNIPLESIKTTKPLPVSFRNNLFNS